MILTGRDIAWYMEQGKLIILPCLNEQLQQNGIDLILSDVNFNRSTNPEGWFYESTPYLGTTQEWIEMPDDLMGFVQLRSTWARCGIILPPTVIDAGFKGNITLEIVSFKHQKAPIGERFAHVIFAKLSGPTVGYSGKYQGQRGITPALPDRGYRLPIMEDGYEQ